MKKTVWSRMAALILALCLLTVIPAQALTGPFDQMHGEPCSLTVTFDPAGVPAQGVRFRLWKVAEVSATGYTPLPFVWQYHVLEGVEGWSAMASTLYGYLLRENVAPTVEKTTDEAGKVHFEALAQGLYLLAGDTLTYGGRIYTPTPNLVCLPNSADFSTWESQVEMTSKYTSRSTGGGKPTTVDRHVLKSWNDGGHEEERPREIAVDLLRDGEVYDTMYLTAENNWRGDWTGLDADADWQVVERESDRYTVLVESQGVTFQVTNTWRASEEDLPDPDVPMEGDPNKPTDPPEEQLWDPDVPMTGPDTPGEGSTGPEGPDADKPAAGDKLPQTGQLWWPVAPLALCGLVCLVIGLVRRRKWSA